MPLNENEIMWLFSMKCYSMASRGGGCGIKCWLSNEESENLEINVMAAGGWQP
jgi:hypothetical protein